MKRKPNQKELKHLRELVGEDGTKVHYFTPASPAVVRQLRQQRCAKQVEEMRQTAGSKPATAPREKADAAAQVVAMRRAAGKPNGLAK